MEIILQNIIRCKIILLFLLTLLFILCCTPTLPLKTEPAEPLITWKTDEFYARLNSEVKDYLLNDFLAVYNEYDLEVLFHDKVFNRFHFSFNTDKIEQTDIMNLLRQDNYVEFVVYYMRLPDWSQGFIIVKLYENVNIDEFIFTYANFGFSLTSSNPAFNFNLFSFNHTLIDEFLFLELIKNDNRVECAEFSYLIILD